MSPDELDRIFAALSLAVRREILDAVEAHPGARVRDIADRFPISRVAVMRHLRLLEEAGLLTSEKQGRERRLYFNPVPIQALRDEWTRRYASFWSERMADLKSRIEADADASADTRGPASREDIADAG
ncbi:MAG: helix-turn-helix transcriptional regulator [Planctomycetota bacterium]